MPKSVTLTHDYPYPADLVWAVATDLDHLRAVVQGLLKFKSLPSGKIEQGLILHVEVSLFGRMPYQPYDMTVVELDDQARCFRSDEKGAGVNYWRHHLRVVETATGSRIEETIEVDAGIMTWAFAAWAKFMYRKRHRPRLEILKTQSASA